MSTGVTRYGISINKLNFVADGYCLDGPSRHGGTCGLNITHTREQDKVTMVSSVRVYSQALQHGYPMPLEIQLKALLSSKVIGVHHISTHARGEKRCSGSNVSSDVSPSPPWPVLFFFHSVFLKPDEFGASPLRGVNFT